MRRLLLIGILIAGVSAVGAVSPLNGWQLTGAQRPDQAAVVAGSPLNGWHLTGAARAPQDAPANDRALPAEARDAHATAQPAPQEPAP